MADAVEVEVPVDGDDIHNATGLTPRFSASTALLPEGGPPPTLTLPAAMKRVHSVGGLAEPPKTAKLSGDADAPTARSRAGSRADEAAAPPAAAPADASEDATRTGFTPEKAPPPEAAPPASSDDDDDSSDDDAHALAWLQRQKRPSFASSRPSGGSLRSRRSSSASKRDSETPFKAPQPAAPSSPVLAGFERKRRESASDRKQRAADRPPPPPPAEAPAAAPPPAGGGGGGGGDDDDDFGGFDDLHALHKETRKRDKHSHNHGVANARNMAIAKRNGQRQAHANAAAPR